MATRDLHEKIGSVEFEKLFAGMEPPAIVKPGIIAHGAAKATYKRGTLLANGADGKLFLMGSEIMSLLALLIMAGMFLADILKERSVQHERF